MRSFKTTGLCLATSLALSPALFFAQGLVQSSPFNPRSTPIGDTLFSLVPSTETGIDVVNSYDDLRMWTERYQEMVFGTIGTGIAVADYDKDGRPDIFVAVKTGGSRLYRNLGDWKFEDVTETAGLELSSESWTGRIKSLFGSDEAENLPWDQGATFADVDNDGWLDLYVTCFDSPNRLYRNQGDGTFLEEAEARGLAIQDACGVAAFCDYDRDGWLDVYLQTNMLDTVAQPEGRPDRLFRNRGDGTFEDVTASAGISGMTSGHSVTWWDYDQDGWPDIYVANDFSAPDKMYRNIGYGKFVDVLEETFPVTSYYSMGADLGDVNNDGLIDLFVGDMAPTTHGKDQRGMAVSRARELANRPYERVPQRMRNSLYLNTGTKKMIEGAWMYGVARSDWTWSTRFEDLDNDGWLDLHVTNGMIREYHNADILTRVMGAISRNSQRMVMKKSPVMEERNLAFRNQGGEGFERVGALWGLDQSGVSFGVASGDFDGDGDLDLVQANYDAPFTVYRNNSQAAGSVLFALRGARSNSYGIGTKIEIETASGKQVRELVNARGYLSSSEPTLHFGIGMDDIILRTSVYWPSGHVQVFENLPSNHRFTIQEPSTMPEVDEGIVSSEGQLFELFQSEGADFDREGNVADTRGLLSFTFSKNGELSEALSALGLEQEGPNRFTDSMEADLDGDGVLELVVSSEWGRVRAYKKSSDSQYEEVELLGLETAGSGFWSCLETGDFNGDGKPDFALGNLGLNTRYRASVDKPAVLFYGNFAGRGETQQSVEAYFEGDRLLPWRSRKELIDEIPPLERILSGSNKYAEKSLEEILSPVALSKAKRFEVTELRSGVLLSSNEGPYQFLAFPKSAQIAPITDFAVADFNRDGMLDLVAAQNHDQVDPVVGYFHGGLGVVMLGDGNGNFRVLDPRESGFSLPGAGWTLDVNESEQDGEIDLIATKANQAKRTFRTVSK